MFKWKWLEWKFWINVSSFFASKIFLVNFSTNWTFQKKKMLTSFWCCEMFYSFILVRHQQLTIVKLLWENDDGMMEIEKVMASFLWIYQGMCQILREILFLNHWTMVFFFPVYFPVFEHDITFINLQLGCNFH